MINIGVREDIDKKPTNHHHGGHHMIAGAFAGIAGVLTGHPLDTLKTRLQAPDERFKTPFQCLRDTIKQEGIRGLYRGIAPPLSTVAISNSITFSVYGKTKSFIPDSYTTKEWQRGAIGGMASGIVATVIVTPRDLIKSRLQIKPCEDIIKANTPKRLHSASLDCIREVWKTHGLRGMYRGGFISLSRDIPGNAAYFATYEGVRKLLTQDGQTRPSVAGLIISGGCAGVTYWSTIYPLDTVRTCIQVQDIINPRFSGFWDCSRTIWAEEGIRGFYKGYVLCLFRAFPISAVNFLIYEAVLNFFEPNY